MQFPGPHPPATAGYHSGPPPPQGFAPPPPGFPPHPPTGPAPPAKPVAQGHNWKDMAIGGAGGALLGGFLTHEYDEHKEHQKEDQWRREHQHEEAEIAALRRQNEQERRQNQGLQSEVYREDQQVRREQDQIYREDAQLRREQGEVYRAEERGPMYGGGEYGRFEERREFDDGFRDERVDYVQRDDTFVENTYVEEQRDDFVRDDFRREEFVQDDSYRQEEFVQDDSYRQEEFVDESYRRDDYQDDSLVDDAARWAGREEQRVEDVPYDIEQKWDRVEDSFDQGQDDQAYDDGRW